VYLEFTIMRTAALALVVAPAVVLGQAPLYGQCTSYFAITFEMKQHVDIFLE
jgi:hypothetical protein